jgi:hypothetical protein
MIIKNKKPLILVVATIVALLAFAFTYPAEKLLDPAKLAATLKDPNAPKPLIINVGPTPLIKGAKFIGSAEDPTNKERLRALLKDYPKNKEVVVYCGCCKLVDCWNIHEADKIVTSMGFTNYKILNLPEDFATDWQQKGYPTE